LYPLTLPAPKSSRQAATSPSFDGEYIRRHRNLSYGNCRCSAAGKVVFRERNEQGRQCPATRQKNQLPLTLFVTTMKITFNAAKRAKTLAERGLDFARAGEVFQGGHVTKDDNRKDYGERRLITWGHLDSRLVVVTWTPRGHAKRIISMRKANEREITRFSVNLG
jgi:uncharacterized DUF497 family protein